MPQPLRFPGYVLGPRVGGGPTCDVYAAGELATGRRRAIKVLRPMAARDPANQQLFRREAQVGRRVRHRHLVRVLHAERKPARLVMEWLPGESVKTVLKREGFLSAKLAIRLARQTASALAAVHEAGFVHGDIKPANLHLVDVGYVKLIDLGFAHRPGEAKALLGVGYALGTANYIAPELCRDHSIDGPAADVFALGVTLFELLTGRRPYPDGRVDEIMLWHRDGRPDSLRAWNGKWSHEVSELVDAMLARDPEERPTAEMVVEGLRTRRPVMVD